MAKPEAALRVWALARRVKEVWEARGQGVGEWERLCLCGARVRTGIVVEAATEALEPQPRGARNREAWARWNTARRAVLEEVGLAERRVVRVVRGQVRVLRVFVPQEAGVSRGGGRIGKAWVGLVTERGPP